MKIFHSFGVRFRLGCGFSLSHIVKKANPVYFTFQDQVCHIVRPELRFISNSKSVEMKNFRSFGVRCHPGCGFSLSAVSIKLGFRCFVSALAPIEALSLYVTWCLVSAWHCLLHFLFLFLYGYLTLLPSLAVFFPAARVQCLAVFFGDACCFVCIISFSWLEDMVSLKSHAGKRSYVHQKKRHTDKRRNHDAFNVKRRADILDNA